MSDPLAQSGERRTMSTKGTGPTLVRILIIDHIFLNCEIASKNAVSEIMFYPFMEGVLRFYLFVGWMCFFR